MPTEYKVSRFVGSGLTVERGQLSVVVENARPPKIGSIREIIASVSTRLTLSTFTVDTRLGPLLPLGR